MQNWLYSRVMRWLLCVGVLSCVWCGELPEATAYKYLRSKLNGRVYHWKRNKFPVQMILENRAARNVPIGTIEQLIKQAMKTWNDVQCSVSQLNLKAVSKGNAVPKYDGVHVIKFLNSGAEWKWSAQELANTIITVNLQTGEILDVDMVLNDWKFTWGTTGKGADFDVLATVTHELGHVLGLAHSTDSGASMYARANAGETSKRNLNKDDRDGLCALYPDQPCEEGKLIGNDTVCFNGRHTPICPRYHELCKDCSSGRHEDCGGSGDFCLNLSQKLVCGFDCSKTKSCPGGYTCVPVQETKNGKPITIGFNCVPDSRNCAGAATPPCCRNPDDCLPSFACVKGQCVRGQSCAKEGEACASKGACCTGMVCVNDSTGGKCRNPCDPLKPRCNGSLRCASTNPNDVKQGACVPPNGGQREGASCDTKTKPCEYELGCDPKDKRCRFFCRVGQVGACPAGSRCVALKQGSELGLCYKDAGGRTCKNVTDCPTGQACVNQKCGPCGNDTDCLKRPTHQCVGGACLQSCTSSAECPAQHRCDRGLCQPGKFCASDKDCSGGSICNQSICAPKGSGGCKSDADCGAGLRCGSDGQCASINGCNNKCDATKEICKQNKCVLKTCAISVECGQGFVCRNSRCEPVVTNCGGKTCPDGQLCNNNRCVGELGINCLGDEQCAPGLTCAQGGNIRLCTKICDAAQAKACPDRFFCTRLSGIGSGCWPAVSTVCKASGNCTPKGEGCGCSATGPQPMGELAFLAILLLFVNMRRRFRRA